MDSDLRHIMRQEGRVEEEFKCRCCQDLVGGYAALDPLEIDGWFFCDHCASDYVSLRIDGYLDSVSDKTHKLKIENANKLFES